MPPAPQPVELSIICSVKNLVDWNRTETFTQMMGSIRDQNTAGLEVLVIDGGSNDATETLVADLIQGMPYAGYHAIPDQGIYEGYQNGLDLAQGTWVAFMNSDDYYEPGALTAFMDLPKDGLDLVYGSTNLLKGSEKIPMKDKLERIFSGMSVCTQSIFFRRTSIQALGGFSLAYRILGDYDLTLRGMLSNWKHARLAHPTAVFRAGGISMTQAELAHEELARIWQNHLTIPSYAIPGLALATSHAGRFTPQIGWELLRFAPTPTLRRFAVGELLRALRQSLEARLKRRRT